MNLFAISFGPCTLSLSEEFLIFRVSDPGSLASVGVKPVLHRGMWADHLSIPLKPRRSGQHAGKYWVHLTYPDGTHVPVAIVDPARAKAVAKAIEAGMADGVRERLVEQIRKVDSDELTAQGYEILFCDPEEFPELLRARLQRGKRHFRVSLSRLQQIAEDMYIATPSIINEEEFKAMRPENIRAIRLDGEARDLCLFYDKEQRWGNSPAWYAWPSDLTQAVAEQVLDVIEKHVGRSFWMIIRAVCVELGLPITFEKIDQVIADGDWRKHLPIRGEARATDCAG